MEFLYWLEQNQQMISIKSYIRLLNDSNVSYEGITSNILQAL